MFANNSFARVWRNEDKGRYSVVEMSTSKKDRETGEYKTDFTSKYVRFLGKAHEKLDDLQENGRIKIINCGVTVEPSSEGKWFTNFLVFDFENADSAGASTPQTDNSEVVVEDDDLPF